MFHDVNFANFAAAVLQHDGITTSHGKCRRDFPATVVHNPGAKYFNLFKDDTVKIVANWLLVTAVLFTFAAEARQTINGCEIKRRASCPGANLSGANLTRSNWRAPILREPTCQAPT
ncbi:MAG: hypothetical protein A2V79_04380 [Betaproteobacteria bacterium RBG_16_56_24]|nr:MAG: hypothetical protein A2V79_04380 [Betaproteobacteria bacterium RBG_16_56_24]